MEMLEEFVDSLNSSERAKLQSLIEDEDRFKALLDSSEGEEVDSGGRRIQ